MKKVKVSQQKPIHRDPLAWFIVFLPYEIALLVALFTATPLHVALGYAFFSYVVIALIALIFKSPFAFLLSLFFLTINN